MDQDSQRQKFVGYTRPTVVGGDAERFLAMTAAYKGFQEVLAANTLLTGVILIGLGATDVGYGRNDDFLVAAALITIVFNVFLTRRPARQYAIGVGRSPESWLGISIPFAVQSWFVMGVIGYAFLQPKMLRELRKYGINPKLGKVPDAELQRIANLIRQRECSAPPLPVDLSKVDPAG